MKKVYFMLLGVLLSTAVMADNKQTVTIDGSQVSKTVKEITFDGDNVTLSYADGTDETQDNRARRDVTIAREHYYI